MDFARKQLEKYGWTTGKGLGKHENGISEALKPKIKRSVTGIGHNAAEDFTEHWWTALYNKAAENLEFEKKDGKSKKFKTKDENAFEITNSTWKLHKKKKDNPESEEYQNFFVKTEILGTGGTEKLPNVNDSDSDSNKDEKKDVFKLTDEELFAACGGRTAHKAARFGLKATGKLARIKEQEEKLLELDKYSGYSHAKNRKKKKANERYEDTVKNTEADSNVDISENGSEKKRKERQTEELSDDDQVKEHYDAVSKETVTESTNIKKFDADCKGKQIKKKKKSKRKFNEPFENNVYEPSENAEIKCNKNKCKQKHKVKQLVVENIPENEVALKKRKRKN